MKNFGFAIICACAALGMSSCGQGARDGFDRGRIENGTYINDYFGFTVDIPVGMYLMCARLMDDLSGWLSTMQGGQPVDHTRLLFFISHRDPYEQDVDSFNYSFSAAVEKLDSKSAIQTNEQYAAAAMNTIGASVLSADGQMATRRTTLGGKDFVSFSIPLEDVPGSGDAVQEIYAHVDHPYVLIFTVTCDRDSREAVDSILQSVSFR